MDRFHLIQHKHMKNLKSLLFASVLLLCSFTSADDDLPKIPRADIKAEMLGEILTKKTLLIKLAIVDDYIIAKFPKPLYHKYNYVYNIKGKKLIGFTENGKELNEVRSDNSLSPIPGGELLTMYDYRSRKVLTYDINSLVAGNIEPTNVRIVEKVNKIIPNALLHASDNRLLFVGQSGSSLRDQIIVLTDQNGKELDRYTDMGEITIRDYLKFLPVAVSPNGEYIARVADDLMQGHVMEILEIGDKIRLKTKLIIPDEIFYDGDPDKYVENPGVFSNVYAANDIIIVSYIGYSQGVNYRVPNIGADHSFIVFDRHNGGVLKIYNTDRACFNFVYNETDNSVYAVVRNENGRPQMARYQLD